MAESAEGPARLEGQIELLACDDLLVNRTLTLKDKHEIIRLVCSFGFSQGHVKRIICKSDDERTRSNECEF